MLKLINDGFTLASILAGLWAAWLWWQSSRIGPIYDGKPPGDYDISDPQWYDKIKVDLNAENKGNAVSQRLNSHAALWTAVSVAAQAVATVVGWISSG